MEFKLSIWVQINFVYCALELLKPFVGSYFAVVFILLIVNSKLLFLFFHRDIPDPRRRINYLFNFNIIKYLILKNRGQKQ